MNFSRCVLLWLLAACGSQRATTVEPQAPVVQPVVHPAAAKPVAVAIVFEGCSGTTTAPWASSS